MKKNFGGYLARRTVLVCGVLIVIPLILYSVYVYFIDYQRHRLEVYDHMEAIETDQLSVMDKWVNFELNTMELIAGLLAKSDESGFEPLLESFMQRDNLTGLFFTNLVTGKEYQCQTCKDKSKFRVTPLLSLSSIQSKGYDLFVEEYPDYGSSVYLSRGSFSGGVLTGVITTVVDLDVLLERLFLIEVSYPAISSLVNEKGLVVSSSDPGLRGMMLSKLDVKGIQDREFIRIFNFEGMTRYGFLQKIPDLSLYIMIDIPEYIVQEHWHTYLWHMTFFLSVILVIGGTGTFFVTRRMSRPMVQLCSVMQEVGENNLEARFQKDRMGFEVNYLGHSLNEMIELVLHNRQLAEDARVEQEVVEKELSIGRDAQESILPRPLPDFEPLDLAAGFVSAKEVAGDFYDCFVLDDDRLFICVADTSGKGIFACLYSLLIRSFLRSFVVSDESLELAIKQANRLFCEDTGFTGTFATAWVGVYSRSSGQLQYSCLGHNAPILKRASGELEIMKTEGMALGVEDFPIDVKQAALDEGDSLVIYSDGIVEAHNKHNDLYSDERLMNLVRDSRWHSAESGIEEILGSVDEFAAGQEQHDDITLLLIRR